MTSYVADALDPANLPPFTLVTVDQAAEKAALIASFTARCVALGIGYDVGTIEGDSVPVLIEEFTFRRCLDLQALNDAGKRMTLSYGYGAALDHIAATYYADLGIRRMPALAAPRPYASHPEDWEADDRFARRIALAPEMRSPFTPGAYVGTALAASLDVGDAVCLNFSQGYVARRGDLLLVILGVEGADEDALCATVQAALDARPIKVETDAVMVRPARRVPIVVDRTLEVLRGPDKGLIQAAALLGAEAYRKDRRHLGRLYSVSGLDKAIHVAGVETVRPGLPAVDVDPGADAIVEPVSTTIDVAVLNG